MIASSEVTCPKTTHQTHDVGRLETSRFEQLRLRRSAWPCEERTSWTEAKTANDDRSDAPGEVAFYKTKNGNDFCAFAPYTVPNLTRSCLFIHTPLRGLPLASSTMAIGKLFGRSQQADGVTEKDGSSSKSPTLNEAAAPNATLNQEQLSDTEEVSSDADEGVKKIRATTIVWSRKALLVAYALCVYHINQR